MPQSLLKGQLKEKPTYRVWCLYSSFVHGLTVLLVYLAVFVEEGQAISTQERLFWSFSKALWYENYFTICLKRGKYFSNRLPPNPPNHRELFTYI